jgi:hypothetical protein
MTSNLQHIKTIVVRTTHSWKTFDLKNSSLTANPSSTKKFKSELKRNFIKRSSASIMQQLFNVASTSSHPTNLSSHQFFKHLYSVNLLALKAETKKVPKH